MAAPGRGRQLHLPQRRRPGRRPGRAEHELFDSIRTRIYVLDGGRVAESGSHDQLIALGGRYAELFTLQASAYLASHSS